MSAGRSTKPYNNVVQPEIVVHRVPSRLPLADLQRTRFTACLGATALPRLLARLRAPRWQRALDHTLPRSRPSSHPHNRDNARFLAPEMCMLPFPDDPKFEPHHAPDPRRPPKPDHALKPQQAARDMMSPPALAGVCPAIAGVSFLL
ncbi:hypothetical protein PLICRDRAFT_279038 [Plicaturopsis crispa FD-325 SS-3]|nr:hypothetical protein PLICRDRAFT_279038 [Plicaturopsis crispa FD-325 SS-3]